MADVPDQSSSASRATVKGSVTCSATASGSRDPRRVPRPRPAERFRPEACDLVSRRTRRPGSVYAPERVAAGSSTRRVSGSTQSARSVKPRSSSTPAGRRESRSTPSSRRPSARRAATVVSPSSSAAFRLGGKHVFFLQLQVNPTNVSATARRTSSSTTETSCSPQSTARSPSGPDGHCRPRNRPLHLRLVCDQGSRASGLSTLQPFDLILLVVLGDLIQQGVAERLLRDGRDARWWDNGGDDRALLVRRVPLPASARADPGGRSGRARRAREDDRTELAPQPHHGRGGSRHRRGSVHRSHTSRTSSGPSWA